MEEIKEEIEIIDKDKEANRSKGEAWKTARALEDQKTAEFMTPQDLYNKVLEIKDLRDRCFIIILYITAARVSEVTRYKKVFYPKKKVRYAKLGKKLSKVKYIPDYSKKPELLLLKSGIKKEDITYEQLNGEEIMVIRLRNLKNKQERIKLVPFKINDELAKKFKQIIDTYLLTVEDGYELFPFEKRNGERIVSQIGFNPHFLRKLRLTHLVRYNNFSDQKLKTFAGWSDSRPSKHYIKIKWQDLVDSM